MFQRILKNSCSYNMSDRLNHGRDWVKGIIHVTLCFLEPFYCARLHDGLPRTMISHWWAHSQIVCMRGISSMATQPDSQARAWLTNDDMQGGCHGVLGAQRGPGHGVSGTCTRTQVCPHKGGNEGDVISVKLPSKERDLPSQYAPETSKATYKTSGVVYGDVYF